MLTFSSSDVSTETRIRRMRLFFALFAFVRERLKTAVVLKRTTVVAVKGVDRFGNCCRSSLVNRVVVLLVCPGKIFSGCISFRMRKSKHVREKVNFCYLLLSNWWKLKLLFTSSCRGRSTNAGQIPQHLKSAIMYINCATDSFKLTSYVTTIII